MFVNVCDGIFNYRKHKNNNFTPSKEIKIFDEKEFVLKAGYGLEKIIYQKINKNILNSLEKKTNFQRCLVW